ncbi:MAG: efflux RND transporter periplasmic adaptor subunit [Pseudomonadota bacterium]
MGFTQMLAPGRARWALLLAIGAALAAGGAWYGWRALAIPAFEVSRADVVQSIVASGHVETPLRVDLGSQVMGKVRDVLAAEGASVKAGQALVQLDNAEASATVEQARAAVVQARARLAQIEHVGLPMALQGLRQAEVNEQNAQRQFKRTGELRAKGFVGQAQLDESQRGLDIAISQLIGARLQVQTNSTQGSDYQMAQAGLAQAQANLHVAQARLEYTTISAPLPGVLIARSVERGDVVQPGKTLMVLSPEGQTELVLQIDEKNLGALRIGQHAIASADAYADQRFDATLTYINPAIDAQRGSVEVKLKVPNAPAYLRQDMTVSVDIEVARRPQALTLPAATLRDSAGAAPWVMKVVNQRAQHQPVTLGLRGVGTVEVLDGVQQGELVLGATAAVKPGQFVRAVAKAQAQVQALAQAQRKRP